MHCISSSTADIIDFMMTNLADELEGLDGLGIYHHHAANSDRFPQQLADSLLLKGTAYGRRKCNANFSASEIKVRIRRRQKSRSEKERSGWRFSKGIMGILDNHCLKGIIMVAG